MTDRDGMKSHLDSGCAACNGSVRALTSVVELAASEARYAVPESLVASVRALFQPKPSRSWVDALELLRGELAFASQGLLAPAGVRSAGGVAPRMLFRAGEYAIDVNVESPLSGGPAEIVGQIANEHNPQEGLGDLLVEVLAAGKTLGETITNRFGEFIIPYPIEKQATLRIALAHRGQRIEFPLGVSRL